MQLKVASGFSIKKFNLSRNDNHFLFINCICYDSFPPVIPFDFIKNSLFDGEPKQIQSTSDSPLLA
tara:strand:- start:77 stop:274 length:198 start_codon:yes stop_codon:yes gene_type:complete